MISEGSPCVAHRVCPIPHLEYSSSDRGPILSLRTDSRPFDFITLILFSESNTATPAESYPRYSRAESPSRSFGTAFSLPVYPIIPHIVKFPLIITTHGKGRMSESFRFRYSAEDKYNLLPPSAEYSAEKLIQLHTEPYNGNFPLNKKSFCSERSIYSLII